LLYPRAEVGVMARCYRQLGGGIIFCLIVMVASSCGYHEVGTHPTLPPDVKTIAVLPFANDTPIFKIEQEITSAVASNLIERTQYKVVSRRRGADAILEGVVKREGESVVALNPATGSATTLQIEVEIGVRLVDLHTKKILFSNPAYIFREQFQVSQTPQNLIQEDPAAMERLSREFARALVTDILANF
jgi:hypothetical protein